MAKKRINWTKLFIFFVVVILVGGIGWIAGSVISQYDVTRYEDSVDIFIGKGVENGGVTAVYGEQKTLLNSSNFQSMRNLLTITERQKLLSAPSTEGKTSITVTVDEKNYFVAYFLNESGDTYLHTCLDGKTRNFFVDGPKYQIFSRMLKYISPEGVYGANESIS
ncbi:MAG TPA: hypothetical protein PK629_11980 [Oscillospiraceae bacterium]|nr:hypothetical protein [Oscillospiraceae bacterium]HPF55864.1 hypothetical protein [Clostridiales bacterium]HPK36436.1 hypothetical protein [Oscillospiraceae bacterium]HPR76379.1 hypothetical protein [Oscillospiraceae bacterium]